MFGEGELLKQKKKNTFPYFFWHVSYANMRAEHIFVFERLNMFYF